MSSSRDMIHGPPRNMGTEPVLKSLVTSYGRVAPMASMGWRTVPVSPYAGRMPPTATTGVR
ncbi:hypothetical protein, partial [Streptomyces sp. Agncl-13]|uniref:hypothetical protein n=1 Tax=Streptomyces sp. Agncl-13 TaxID=3400628 RepID=UPI003A8BF528